jgi:hypothetical protein
MEDHQKKCAIVSADLINTLGANVPKPVPLTDIVKLVDMSDTILYNKEDTMRGRQHTLAVDVSNSGSWIRFNVAQGDEQKVEEIIRYINCK